MCYRQDWAEFWHGSEAVVGHYKMYETSAFSQALEPRGGGAVPVCCADTNLRQTVDIIILWSWGLWSVVCDLPT
jgi:hypothetical protein